MNQSTSTIKVAAFADLHGVLPEPVECDLAIVAGDVCPNYGVIKQYAWLEKDFRAWVCKFPRLIWIAGNHDKTCEESPSLLPYYDWHRDYLRDNEKEPFHPFVVPNKEAPEEFSYLKVWGTPWSLPYGKSYAFMRDEDYIHRRLGDPRAQRATILVSHGPPYGYGDLAPRHNDQGNEIGTVHAGSWALRMFIDKYQPPLVVYGHIHEGRGVYECGKSTLVNAAMAGKSVGYGLDYGPVIVTLGKIGSRTVVLDTQLL